MREVGTTSDVRGGDGLGTGAEKTVEVGSAKRDRGRMLMLTEVCWMPGSHAATSVPEVLEGTRRAPTQRLYRHRYQCLDNHIYSARIDRWYHG